jgi:hypothetical protein
MYSALKNDDTAEILMQVSEHLNVCRVANVPI